MAQHKAVEPDPKELKRAQEIWHGFTNFLKYSVIACVATLAALGLFLIDW